jgi:transposase-like protein
MKLQKEYISTIINPKPVMAKCPRCERHHIVPEYDWTGRGVPRVFCPACKWHAQQVAE